MVQLVHQESDHLLIFRLWSDQGLELEVRDDLSDEEVVFSVRGYHRGGGSSNAAMDYHDILLQDHGLDYDVYYVWCANEDGDDIESDPIFGVTVSQDGEELVDMKGREVLTGEISGWSFSDLLPEATED